MPLSMAPERRGHLRKALTKRASAALEPGMKSGAPGMNDVISRRMTRATAVKF